MVVALRLAPRNSRGALPRLQREPARPGADGADGAEGGGWARPSRCRSGRRELVGRPPGVDGRPHRRRARGGVAQGWPARPRQDRQETPLHGLCARARAAVDLARPGVSPRFCRPGVPPLRAGLASVRLASGRATGAVVRPGGRGDHVPPGDRACRGVAVSGMTPSKRPDVPPKNDIPAAPGGSLYDVRSISATRKAAADEEVTRLVRAAAGGDHQAWQSLVGRYVALLWSIAFRHGLNESDAADVVQNTWLRLFEHIDDVREPARVGSWLATTAQRESLRLVAQHQRVVPSDDEMTFDGADRLQAPLDEALLAREQVAQARAALDTLPPTWRSLVEALTQEPPLTYEEIVVELGVPIGSIGPTRGRSVRRLRELVAD